MPRQAGSRSVGEATPPRRPSARKGQSGCAMVAPAPTEDDRATSRVEDYDAIRDVVQMCLDGEATGDVEKLRTAFHEDARMFGSLAGERYDGPISELIEMSAKAPADTGQYRSRILSVHQTGDAALALVVEEGYWGTVSFIDYLSLARINDRWKIVNKLFAHTGASHPTSGSARRRLAGLDALSWERCVALERVSRRGPPARTHASERSVGHRRPGGALRTPSGFP